MRLGDWMSRYVEKNVRCANTEKYPAAANLAGSCDGSVMRWVCFRKSGACEYVCVARESVGLVQLGGCTLKNLGGFFGQL